MAKLLDLAAVYGKSNPAIVQSMIDNLFAADKRFVQDFKESVDLMVTQVKKAFKEYATIQAMIKGEHIKEMTKSELESTILDFLTDYTELLSTFNLIIQTFPNQVLDSLRGTNCLTMQMKRDLYEKLKIFIPTLKKDSSRDTSIMKLQGYAFAAEIQTIKRLCMQTACGILTRVLLNMIGQHTVNFAVVQNQIAQQLKLFILASTGNSELSKEVLGKQQNYISLQIESGSRSSGKQSQGTIFLTRILRRVNIYESIENIEERFLPDGDKEFLKIIVQSLMQGQKVHVQKISALASANARSQASQNEQHKKQENLTL
jgi:hypothetical protein